MRHAAARAFSLILVVLASNGCSLHAAEEHTMSVGNEVNQAELTASGASSLYDALVRTRGLYFRHRGASSINNSPTDAILVFRSGALMGTTESLRMMRPGDVRFVRRLTPMETYHKYGRRVSVAGLEIELATP
jgi:hypothetical protein